MTKVIFPRSGEEWLHVKLIGTCIVVRNYVETHYETQQLRCYCFCGKESSSWKFNCINDVLTFYAYLLNHMGMNDFKLRLKQKIVGDPTRSFTPRRRQHLPIRRKVTPRR